MLHRAGDWKGVNEHIVLLSKRRAQLKQAVAALVKEAMGYVEKAPDMATKVALIETLGAVTSGKIFVEVEKARLTRQLAKIKEEQGKPEEAAEIMQEVAVETYGADNVECYISYFKPLEWSVNHEENNGVAVRGDNKCFVKLITNLADDERVVGFHYLGPNAGEVTQGYAVAMKMGAKKSDFDETVGIHPTVSEEFTTLEITKRSGVDATNTGC